MQLKIYELLEDPKSSRTAWVISSVSMTMVGFSVATVCKFCPPFPWLPVRAGGSVGFHAKRRLKISSETYLAGAETVKECSESATCVEWLQKSDLAGGAV